MPTNVILRRHRNGTNLGYSHTEGAHVMMVETVKERQMLSYIDYDINIFGQNPKKLDDFGIVIVDCAYLPMLGQAVESTFQSFAEVQTEYDRRFSKVDAENEPIDADYEYDDSDPQQRTGDIDQNPIYRPGWGNLQLQEDYNEPKRMFLRKQRLGFLDGAAVRVGNEASKYMTHMRGRLKGFTASHPGYLLWQMHNIGPPPEEREEKDWFPKDASFKNLSFLTLQSLSLIHI